MDEECPKSTPNTSPAAFPGSCEQRKALPRVRFAAALGRCSPRPRACSGLGAWGEDGAGNSSSPGNGVDKGCLCQATSCCAREPSRVLWSSSAVPCSQGSSGEVTDVALCHPCHLCPARVTGTQAKLASRRACVILSYSAPTPATK